MATTTQPAQSKSKAVWLSIMIFLIGWGFIASVIAITMNPDLKSCKLKADRPNATITVTECEALYGK